MKLVLLDDDGTAISELPEVERYNLTNAYGRSEFLDDTYWMVRNSQEDLQGERAG